jgi:hypothetical protein
MVMLFVRFVVRLTHDFQLLGVRMSPFGTSASIDLQLNCFLQDFTESDIYSKGSSCSSKGKASGLCVYPICEGYCREVQIYRESM